MFSPRRDRLTTLLLLAAYLTATTASDLFHNHPDGRHVGGPLAPASCKHVAASHDHGTCDAPDHDAVAASIEHAQGGAAHDEDCIVCRYVSERVVAADIGQLTQLGQLTATLAAVEPCTCLAAMPRTTHSRAPPVFG